MHLVGKCFTEHGDLAVLSNSCAKCSSETSIQIAVYGVAGWPLSQCSSLLASQGVHL
jgi:hypothetical protein